MNFNELGLPDHLLLALEKLGFTEPTPIQKEAIPPLLRGTDVLGQAQTGTGKTAAFALPLLAKINPKQAVPQILVLTPTRELALQVSEAFSSFAINMPSINILPVYGGQGFSTQLNALRRGAHVIIGTPGRVMDHMRRGALVLDNLKTLILDEADEMLRMGFAEDVDWILQHIPTERQIGLFSATMPPAIKAIAQTHLRNPEHITIKNKTSTAATIQQFFFPVSNGYKVDALARVIETQDYDAMIVFVKTKRATEEVAEELSDRGFNAVAINGDIVQKQRERVIDHLKSGKIRILVATDVAARGIDVDRITHVINYDAPNNSESYVHRIGRTGRAGRTGTAILFITPRERYLLRMIEQATKQPISDLETPSIRKINDRRVAAFKQRITDGSTQNISFFATLIEEYMQETSMPATTVAATLAKLLQGDVPLVLKKDLPELRARDSGSRDRGSRDRAPRERGSRDRDFGDRAPRDRGSRESRDREASGDRAPRERGSRESSDRAPRERTARDFSDRAPRERTSRESSDRAPRERTARDFSDRAPRERTTRDFSDRAPRERGSRESSGRDFSDRAPRERGSRQEYGMDQYRIEVGHEHGIQPKNLVGAIAHTAGLEGRLIGKIKIEAKFSLVDLPKDMPKNTLQSLQRLKLAGKQMNLKKVSS